MRVPSETPAASTVATVTQEFFSTLGVEPRLGAGFPVDPKLSYYYDPSDIPGVIVSDRLWRTRLESTRDLSKWMSVDKDNRLTRAVVLIVEINVAGVFLSHHKVWH